MPELTEHELETAKMYQDSFKHLTTFSAGAILLSSSVSAAFFKNPTNSWTLYLSLSCFLFSAALATTGLYITVNHLDKAFRADTIEAEPGRAQYRRSALFRLSSSAAYTGVVGFSAFAVMNFN